LHLVVVLVALVGIVVLQIQLLAGLAVAGKVMTVLAVKVLELVAQDILDKDQAVGPAKVLAVIVARVVVVVDLRLFEQQYQMLAQLLVTVVRLLHIP
jgi:flagellar biosynthesis regulator FlbT